MKKNLFGWGLSATITGVMAIGAMWIGLKNLQLRYCLVAAFSFGLVSTWFMIAYAVEEIKIFIAAVAEAAIEGEESEDQSTDQPAGP
jgi:hypothetical protein